MNSVDKIVVLHCLKSLIDEEACEECPIYGTTGTDHCEKECVRLAINELEQGSKKGHWIKMDEGFSPYECSECGSVEFIMCKYCPNCGAKMI